MEILIIINIVATLFTAYWLTKENKAQATVISTLKTQLDSLNPFVDIIRKVADPAEIDRLISVKKSLMEHDTEIQRRQIIENTSKQMIAEFSKRFEMEVKPQYGNALNEFANFIIMYFSVNNFPDKIDRNAHLRMYFPTQADILIKYLDEVSDSSPTRDDNL